MGYADRSYSYSPGRGDFGRPGGGPGDGGSALGGLGRRVTPWVKRLLIANAAVYLGMEFGLLPPRWIVEHLGFSAAGLLTEPWTPITYMFVHGGFLHVLVNMVVLFFFGPPLERAWGGGAFIRYYLVAGLGGALFSILLLPLPAVSAQATVVGASGAIFGLMLAFGLLWPETRVYIWGILPIRAKWFVLILTLFTLYATFAGGGGNVAHWAHLGGLATGFGYLRWGDRLSRSLDRLADWWASVLPISSTSSTEEGRDLRVRRGGGRRRGAREAPGAGGSHPDDATSEEVLDEVDRILDKIREEGLDSLSDEEREFLDEMSRRYRG